MQVCTAGGFVGFFGVPGLPSRGSPRAAAGALTPTPPPGSAEGPGHAPVVIAQGRSSPAGAPLGEAGSPRPEGLSSSAQVTGASTSRPATARATPADPPRPGNSLVMTLRPCTRPPARGQNETRLTATQFIAARAATPAPTPLGGQGPSGTRARARPLVSWSSRADGSPTLGPTPAQVFCDCLSRRRVFG